MKNILVFSGAGISKESGIPTFEDLGDLRDGLRRSRFITDPQGVYDDIMKIREACIHAEPNEAHKVLAQYQIPTITMNVDGLHRKAGLKETNLIEIHGNMEEVFCKECNELFPFSVIENSIHCPKCNTVLEHYLVLYEDDIPRLREATMWTKHCDTLVVVGTSFYTSTSSYIYEEAMRRGKEVHIINDRASIELPKLIRNLRSSPW